MITTEFAQSFAEEWIASWNAHDLERILSHYTDDFSIKTPMAVRLLADSNGLVEGKEAVRAYWRIGLDKIPDLHFELIELLVGIDGLTLYYLNTATGRKTAEVMTFDATGKVKKVEAYYTQ